MNRTKRQIGHMDLVTAQHKAGERSLQMQDFGTVFQTIEIGKHPRWQQDMKAEEFDVGLESRRASRRHQYLRRGSHGFGHGTSTWSDVRTEDLILVPLDRFVLPSGDLPPQIITDTLQHFPFSVPALVSLLV